MIDITHAAGRHSHWGFLNADEAIDAELFAPDGNGVIAKLDEMCEWVVSYGDSPQYRTATSSWITTASMLNHLGVLPRAEHEQWLRINSGADDGQEACPCCGGYVEPDVIHSGNPV